MSRLRTALLLSAVLAVTGLPGLGGTTPASAATPTAGQSTYVPVSPVRLMDTREASDPLSGALGAGGTKDLQVAGVGAVPAGATAVILNVTVVQPTSGTDIRVYPTPTDAAFPVVSNLNAARGVTVANLVTVKVGEGGRVRLRNESGVAHLVADLSGYYVAGGSGSSYTGTTPRRLLDTREGAGALGPGEVRQLGVIGGERGAPVGSGAVVLNVTAVSPTQGTDVRVYPSGSAQPPTVSNLNPPARQTTPAAVVVAVGGDGAVSLRNEAGAVHLVVDLSGWYVPGTDGAVFHPLAPVRLLDQRTPPTPLGTQSTADLGISGLGTVPPMASAVVLNVTATGVSAPSDVRVYPTPNDESVPNASNLNVVRGQTVPNTVFATLGKNGAVRMRNQSGSLSLIVDLAGWFGPAGEGWDISWPQCQRADGASDRTGTSHRHPEGGSFAVIGLNNGRPLTRNACFESEYAWASSLAGDPSVYVNTNAPGTDNADWGAPGPRSCNTAAVDTNGKSTDPGCGWNWGWALAGYSIPIVPTDFDGSRPMVWLDVEGPYSAGPIWQTKPVNREVLLAAVSRFQEAGIRIGVYTEHAKSTAPDWAAIVGADFQLPTLQNWLFPAPASAPETFCEPARSATGGPVVMAQYQTQPDGVTTYDTNHPC